MQITSADVIQIVARAQRRADAIRLVGGVSFEEMVCGKPVPHGFVPDRELMFYVPADFVFSEQVH